MQLATIGIPKGVVINTLPDNEITRLINQTSYMSVDHMVECLCIYTMSFLHESRAGIRKRHLVRYDEAVYRIWNNRSL